jgi:hypothetical protein
MRSPGDSSVDLRGAELGETYVAKAPSKAEYAALLRGRAAPAIEIPLT